MLSAESKSDYDNTKKAEYYDKEGYAVADKANMHKLKSPESVEKLKVEEKE